MKRKSVSSSNISSIGYDETSVTLEIEFSDSGVYQYYGVPPGVHEGIMHASSKGSYFASYIRDSYRYAKIS
ncbi:KTSC domain-containing protein [Patescibacteria group bacterium]|nr:KTSC domain-containing protein [Patescibacteria group bacterium]